MSEVAPTSVEIFCDRDFLDQPIDAAYNAISYIGSLIGGMTVVDDTRKIKIASDDSQTFNPEKIRWPELPAEVSIVLTGRRMLNVRDDKYLKGFDSIWGYALHTNKTHPNLAIVNTAEEGFGLSTIIVHELGHIFNLKESGITKDPQSEHCRLDYCAMRPIPEDTTHEVRILRNRPLALLEKVGLKRPEYRSEPGDRVLPFCVECTDQIVKEGFRRSLQRRGLIAPPYFKL
jgi:hypothetical protein